MSGAFHQVGAARHLLVGAGGRGEVALAGEQQLPPGHGPAHVQGPGNGRIGAGLVDRRDVGHEVGVERLDVAVGHDGVRRIRHGRIERRAVLADAVLHRVLEVGVAVGADARGLVGRDVGRVDGADRRLHRQAAREGLVARHAVTGDTVGGARDIGAGFGQPAVLRIHGGGAVRLADGGQQVGAADPAAYPQQRHQRHRLDPEMLHLTLRCVPGSAHVGCSYCVVQLMEAAYAFQ